MPTRSHVYQLRPSTSAYKLSGGDCATSGLALACSPGVGQLTLGLRVNGEIPTGGAQRDGEAGDEIKEAHEGQHQEHAGARRLDQQELDEIGGEHQRRE